MLAAALLGLLVAACFGFYKYGQAKYAERLRAYARAVEAAREAEEENREAMAAADARWDELPPPTG